MGHGRPRKMGTLVPKTCQRTDPYWLGRYGLAHLRPHDADYSTQNRPRRFDDALSPEASCESREALLTRQVAIGASSRRAFLTCVQHSRGWVLSPSSRPRTC